MASNNDYPTTSDDDESFEDEKTTGGSFRNGEFQGRLLNGQIIYMVGKKDILY